MALPKEPRQKMINVMYLVLTALLALNVSSEILNAFKTVNASLESTNATVDKSTATIIASLEGKAKDPQTAEKAGIWLPKAKQVQQLSTDLYNYINGVKTQIIEEAGGDPANLDNPDKKMKEDNLDIATRLMVTQNGGKDLYNKLQEYKNQVLAVDPSIKDEFEATFPVSLEIPKGGASAASKTWEGAYFNMVPTVATLTILSKFQNDVKTAENRVVQALHNKVGEVAVIQDAFAAIAVANANYVMPGEPIEITAGVGGFSTKAAPVISIGGAVTPVGPDGTAKRVVNAPNAVGRQSITVNIQYTDQNGKVINTPKTIEYTVGQASASIALDDMNVLYAGVPNAVTVAASGAGSDRVRATISKGTLTSKGAGKYEAMVPAGDNVQITVTVDGKVAGVGTFRTRQIPKASAFVGGYESGARVKAATFMAQSGVGAGIKDFPMNLIYTVNSFEIVMDGDEGVIPIAHSGNIFSDRAKTAMRQNLKAGSIVTIEKIKVKGPDGRIVDAPSLIYNID